MVLSKDVLTVQDMNHNHGLGELAQCTGIIPRIMSICVRNEEVADRSTSMHIGFNTRAKEKWVLLIQTNLII